MKFIPLITLVIFFTNTVIVNAQYNTGDNELNQSLITIDANAKLDFGSFTANISGSYDISEKKLDYLHVELGMKAGDIYLSVELARILNKDLDGIVEVYQKNKSKGWGVIAKELGIKPGSPEFHALKGNAKSKKNKNGKGKGKKKG